MIHIKFPHVSRKFSASLLSYSQNSLLWTGLTIFFLLNVYAEFNVTPGYQKELQRVLLKPFSSVSHEALAHSFWQLGFISAAQRELGLANVLGATTENRFSAWTSEPARVKSAYEYWKSVIAAKPDYRDAYISLAASAYQLGYLEEAKSAIGGAMKLSPDNSEVVRLAKFLTLY